jgi:hypothetical protein
VTGEAFERRGREGHAEGAEKRFEREDPKDAKEESFWQTACVLNPDRIVCGSRSSCCGQLPDPILRDLRIFALKILILLSASSA